MSALCVVPEPEYVMMSFGLWFWLVLSLEEKSLLESMDADVSELTSMP